MSATSTIDRPQVHDGIPLLDEHPPRFGPVSKRLLLRLIGVLAVIQLVGAWLTFVVGSDRAVAAGLSLTFPGAGLLYVASPMMFVLTMALLVVALVLWWGISAHIAIPLVWVGSLVAAVALVDGPRVWTNRGATWSWAIPVAYALALATVARTAWRVERRYRRKVAKVPELNQYLSTAELPARTPVVREPDPMDAELVRWCYDLALQPDDGLKGLDWGEQFHGGTQLRYQLNAYSWALAVFAVNFVPNAPAQVEEALAKLVEKHTDLRVWKYWRTLNLLGNFDANPDPIRRDNIMFSAFLGDVINMYEAATGSKRFDEPGSLTFVWKDGRTFAYDHHTITEAVKKNFDRSRLGFFPCEPGWSFTVCNIMGAQSLYGHDTMHGSSTWSEVKPRWVRALDEEYLTPDGSYAHIRSNHVGLSWDTGEVPGGHYFANGTNRFADILPGHAKRAAMLELRGAKQKMAALATKVRDGRLEMELPAVPERHRTRSTSLPPWTGVIAGARAVGEQPLSDAALDASARQCGTGKRWPERPLHAGASALAGHMIVRWSTPTGTAALNMRGYVPPVGPVLESTAWDDVLVVKARSADGATLELSLEPWRSPIDGAVALGFRQLQPGRRYELFEGPAGIGAPIAEILADSEGRGVASLPSLRARVELRLVPVGVVSSAQAGGGS